MTSEPARMIASKLAATPADYKLPPSLAIHQSSDPITCKNMQKFRKILVGFGFDMKASRQKKHGHNWPVVGIYVIESKHKMSWSYLA